MTAVNSCRRGRKRSRLAASAIGMTHTAGTSVKKFPASSAALSVTHTLPEISNASAVVVAYAKLGQ